MNTHLVTIALLVFSVAALDKCVPDCTNVTPGVAVPDPWNCTQFYYCLNDEVPMGIPHSCESGNHFDASVNLCVPGLQCQTMCGACHPDCSGHSEGDFVEDPMDCTQFYVCVHENEPSQHPIACEPPTGVFDPVNGICVSGDTCDSSCSGGACHIRCRGDEDRVANPQNCREYFQCDGNLDLQGPVRCPSERPYFDGWNCVEDSWKCCVPECSPYCHAGDVQIIDPYDCTKYYICTEEGPPQEANHHSCLHGETFQPSSSKCEAGAPCLTLCGNNPTTTTTSTTFICTSFPDTKPPTTTTTTTTDSDCVASLNCPGKGNYAMCEFCSEGYFKCHASGEGGVAAVCESGFLFNTDPTYPFCVEAAECPYTPPPFV
ncbi:peritrophin-48-like [Scylla paramamosain]|uniref:peritrophin-48-like n=1 Tax=Scylla paramamosain TaxID=85552 RepID=UPI003083043C